MPQKEKLVANIQLYEMGQLQGLVDSNSNLESGWRLRRTGRLLAVGYATGSEKVRFDVSSCGSKLRLLTSCWL